MRSTPTLVTPAPVGAGGPKREVPLAKLRTTSAAAIASTRPPSTIRLVVADLNQIQAPRRRCRAGLAALAPFQQRGELLGRALEHGADERPHHVAQERVGRDLELERRAAAVPDRRLDRAE